MGYFVGNQEPGVFTSSLDVSYDRRGDGCFLLPRRSEPATRFEIFYSAEFGAVVRFASLKMASRQCAEDLASEAFVVTFSRWPQLDPWLDEPDGWSRVKNYILSILRNLVCDFYRRPQRGLREIAVEKAELDRAVAEPGDSYVDVLDVFQRAVGKLPKRQTEVLLMGIEGYTVAEIAQRLEISESTVRSHLASARRLLRPSLADLGGGAHGG